MPGRTIAFVILLCVACLLACGGREATSKSGQGLARVKAAGVLRWGGDIQGGEPYVYDDPKKPGHLIGFEVEIGEAIAKELGVQSEFVQNDWTNLVPSLERGSFDMVMNGLEVTDTRVGRVLFTRPYYAFAERLMARRDDTSIKADLEALRGRKVGTLSNSLAYEMLRTTTDPVVYEGTEEPYADLVNGRTDAVLLDDIIATRYGEPKPELKVVGNLREGYYAIALRPSDPDLRDAVDAALAKIAERGELQAILERNRLWNDRQPQIRTWSAVRQSTMLGEPPPPPPMSLAHFVLFLKGAAVTLFVSALAMMLAVPLGLLLAIARMFGHPIAAKFASAYVEVYRGTPVLLQLYLLYYGLAPILKLGALPAAIIGLGMNYASYEAEVYRAGMQAVPKAQLESALALGMPMRLALRRVIVPQALRHALPNVTNDFIALLKDSSLVSVITVVELTKQMTITAVDVRTWVGPGLLCAGLYFAMSYPLGIVSRRLEKKLEGEREAPRHMIAIKALKKAFDGRTILNGISLDFEKGKVTTMVGPSGGGKSTLLRCINGLETFDAGAIEVAGIKLGPGVHDRAHLRAVRLKAGMVFQAYGLFSHMSALKNVMEAPVHVKKLPLPEARARAEELLEQVGLSHRKDAFPRELSGGEQQRVAIARALAMDPEALLLDEPTSALDPERKVEVVKVLRDLAKNGATMIIVTHEVAVVRDFADRMIVLKNGTIAADGKPSDVIP